MNVEVDKSVFVVEEVRNLTESKYVLKFSRNGMQFTVCTSRGERGDFTGRVTDYLEKANPDLRSDVFLCGNSNMIYDAMDILHSKGFPQKQIFTEVYF